MIDTMLRYAVIFSIVLKLLNIETNWKTFLSKLLIDNMFKNDQALVFEKHNHTVWVEDPESLWKSLCQIAEMLIK